MKLDKVFQEKVYAGVLGKIIGVYLGRPFEQWSHELIMETLGPIEYYVNDRVGKPLVVPDDDITGTFSFIRALSDYGNKFDISPKDIGQTWLNNIVEGETILWWGGVGHSTEHTAFQNLRNGIVAPKSGSHKTNGKGISEQIGAQIFIDGWAMVCPGDPEKAADLAKRAASVSHDGEAIYGAQVIAAMESLAFIESNIHVLLEAGKNIIPRNSKIYQLINDIQFWHVEKYSWQETHNHIVTNYGYDKFPGACHMIPNHALIIMALLYGDGDFHKSMMIINTAGWDTDCNAGNLGCLLGIKNGLKGLDSGPDWRSPVKDVMYCPTAIGSETVTDAVKEAYKIINIARGFKNLNPLKPKNGARYHFEMPGSVQGWSSYESKTFLNNVVGNSELGERSLEIRFDLQDPGSSSEIFVHTFFPETVKRLTGLKKEVFFSYNFLSCPELYPGQKIIASVKGGQNEQKDIKCYLFVKVYGENDTLVKIVSESYRLSANQSIDLAWTPVISDGHPVAQIGLKFESDHKLKGKVFLDFLKITGEPKTSFMRPSHVPIFERGRVYDPPRAEMWRNSWVKACHHWTNRDIKGADYKIGNDKGRGIILTGSSDWENYQIKADITLEMVKSGGIAIRVQGLERYYALELTKDHKARLIKVCDGIKVLKEIDFDIELNRSYSFSLIAHEEKISGSIDKVQLIFTDSNNPLLYGGIGLVVEEGTLFTNKIDINK